MPINWILGHKPQQSPTCPQRQFIIYPTLISFRVIHSHPKARFGNKFQSDLLHKFFFLLLHLMYLYVSNEIILTLNVYLHHLG